MMGLNRRRRLTIGGPDIGQEEGDQGVQSLHEKAGGDTDWAQCGG